MNLRRTIVLAAGGLLLVAASVVIRPAQAGAQGLQIRPLLYSQKINIGETKKGFVDVSNATHTPVTVVLKVQSFRKIDSKGTLEFFNSETIRGGVVLDLNKIDLGPSEAVRVYFQIDAAKLPEGDNFAAIFAATQTGPEGGAAPSAQVGTLLILENGAGGPHNAKIAGVSAPLISFGSSLHGEAAVENTGKPKQASAFFPRLTTTLGPWSGVSKQSQGPLISSGITRNAQVSVDTRNLFGIYRLTAATQGSAESRWVLLITGMWRWIVPLVLLLAVGIFVAGRRYRLQLQWVPSRKSTVPEPTVDHSPEPIEQNQKPEKQDSAPVAPPANSESYEQLPQLNTEDKNTPKKSKKTTKRHYSSYSKTKAKKTTKKSRKH